MSNRYSTGELVRLILSQWVCVGLIVPMVAWLLARFA